MDAVGLSERVLAVASGGGHWVQLMRLRPVFSGMSVSWMATHPEYRDDVDGRFHLVQDANLWNKLALAKMFVQVGWVLLRERPRVVVTTGAAPGFAAIVFGRLLGARTIWIDSIANSETLSTSGARAGRWAHVWLTQWPHLAVPGGPQYWGAIL
jgi:UDP-N-acetylglucosamine:LPS N-acetylglucosamine transferase